MIMVPLLSPAPGGEANQWGAREDRYHMPTAASATPATRISARRMGGIGCSGATFADILMNA
jgi:hypothetical protein